jgi:hypothetical protein
MELKAMQHLLSPWATKADVEVAREELKADIAALHDDVRAVRVLLTNQVTAPRPWWRRLFAANAR